jgi:peroxiredoxin
MAQLRQDFVRFEELGVELVVVGPEGPKAFKDYFENNDLPFVGLPDPQGSVLKLFGQEVNLFKLGRLPAQVLIDRDGIARYAHYGKGMSDIPSNETLFDLINTVLVSTAVVKEN